jgi:predicted outer membrane repeat protein
MIHRRANPDLTGFRKPVRSSTDERARFRPTKGEHKIVKRLWFMVVIVTTFITGAAAADHSVMGQTTIGDGTAASCQTEEAANALGAAVAAGGEINFNCGPDPVVINVNTNATDEFVVVNGGGLVTLSGENLRQIFYVYGSGGITLNDLTLIDGDAGSGGALALGPQASAMVYNTFFISNESAGNGGAIHNQGVITINRSTLGSNIAGGNGGAIYNDGGIVNLYMSYLISNQAASGGGIASDGGSLLVENSAFRSNIAINLGGGVLADGNDVAFVNNTFSNNRADYGGGLHKNGTVMLTNNTFNENWADHGGALYNGGGTTTVKNNIFANSLDEAGGSPSLNCDGPVLQSEGRNIVSDNACVPNPSSVGDLLATDPLLDIWQGSPWRSHPPLPNSPAINYGMDCPGVDQNLRLRPVGAACDVGSIEYARIVYLPLVIK